MLQPNAVRPWTKPEPPAMMHRMPSAEFETLLLVVPKHMPTKATIAADLPTGAWEQMERLATQYRTFGTSVKHLLSPSGRISLHLPKGLEPTCPRRQPA